MVRLTGLVGGYGPESSTVHVDCRILLYSSSSKRKDTEAKRLRISPVGVGACPICRSYCHVTYNVTRVICDITGKAQVTEEDTQQYKMEHCCLKAYHGINAPELNNTSMPTQRRRPGSISYPLN